MLSLRPLLVPLLLFFELFLKTAFFKQLPLSISHGVNELGLLQQNDDGPLFSGFGDDRAPLVELLPFIRQFVRGFVSLDFLGRDDAEVDVRLIRAPFCPCYLDGFSGGSNLDSWDEAGPDVVVIVGFRQFVLENDTVKLFDDGFIIECDPNNLLPIFYTHQ